MKDTVLVSIAVITYNQKLYIKECLDSILNQDYGNIEIVVADDGSTDGTAEIIKEYKAAHKEKIICCLSETNKGITHNSNAAHFACNGKYIAWMGGDDLMLPSKIRIQVEYMEMYPECSICYHNLEAFDSSSGKVLFLSSIKSKPYQGDVKCSIRRGCFNGASATMVRRSNTPVHGFDTRIPVASDWLFWVETLLNGGEIHYINKILARYRRHSNSITALDNTGNYFDHILSGTIILTKYPYLRKDVFYRMSRVYRQFAKLNKNNFIDLLKISLKYSYYYKNLISVVLYYITFKKVKT